MRVRIGIAETGKTIEIEVDDDTVFRKEIGEAIDGGTTAWFTDIRGRSVGIPGKSVAYVEIDDPEADARVGFVPG